MRKAFLVTDGNISIVMQELLKKIQSIEYIRCQKAWTTSFAEAKRRIADNPEPMSSFARSDTKETLLSMSSGYPIEDPRCCLDYSIQFSKRLASLYNKSGARMVSIVVGNKVHINSKNILILKPNAEENSHKQPLIEIVHLC